MASEYAATANDFADLAMQGKANIEEVKWHKGKPSSRALLVRLVYGHDRRTILVYEGTHPLYDRLKAVAE